MFSKLIQEVVFQTAFTADLAWDLHSPVPVTIQEVLYII